MERLGSTRNLTDTGRPGSEDTTARAAAQHSTAEQRDLSVPDCPRQSLTAPDSPKWGDSTREGDQSLSAGTVEVLA